MVHHQSLRLQQLLALRHKKNRFLQDFTDLYPAVGQILIIF